jgi:hypothetical protein
MKLGHSADEIKYDSTTGTVARHLVVLEGKPVMDILCDTADPQSIIRIQRSGRLVPDTQDTAGRFAITTEILEDADGAPLGVSPARVNEVSVYTYVVPRLHVLLARLLNAAG